MNFISAAGLRPLGLDVKAVARQRGADQPAHPLLPPAVLAFTRHWLALVGKSTGGKVAPQWHQFDILDVNEAVPYLTFLRCEADGSFTFTFMGSAVSAVIGEDLTGRVVDSSSPHYGAIDWYRRLKPVAETADIQVMSGRTDPPYTSSIEFVAADFPFLGDAGGAVTHIVGVTVARIN